MTPASPRRPATAKMPNAERQPAQHLHHAEVVVDLGLRARAAVGIDARHHLRAHGVGDDVLHARTPSRS